MKKPFRSISLPGARPSRDGLNSLHKIKHNGLLEQERESKPEIVENLMAA